MVAGNGATIVIGEQPIPMTAVQRESALGRYLSHVISRNRYLQLQGIRSGGGWSTLNSNISTLPSKATRTRTLEAEEAWPAEERQHAPGEWQKLHREPHTETMAVTVEEASPSTSAWWCWEILALARPHSYATWPLCYARDRAEGTTVVRDRLGCQRVAPLPILCRCRNLGAYLKANHPTDDGTEGHGRLLAFLHAYSTGRARHSSNRFL